MLGLGLTTYDLRPCLICGLWCVCVCVGGGGGGGGVTVQVVVMETAPQSRWTHKHCITQCISVEPPSSSLRPSPLLVWLSAPSRLHSPYRERDIGVKGSHLTIVGIRVFSQL